MKFNKLPTFIYMCDPLYFNGITAEAFSKVTVDLAAAGFELNGPSGIVNGPYGIVINYEWTEASQSLKIVVVEKNFLVSCKQIHTKLSAALEKYAVNAG